MFMMHENGILSAERQSSRVFEFIEQLQFSFCNTLIHALKHLSAARYIYIYIYLTLKIEHSYRTVF